VLIGGGSDGSETDTIEYVNAASTGNASDFGNLTQARNYFTALSDGTKGVFGAGTGASRYDIIDYVVMASLGNASDFGNLIRVKSEIGQGMSGD